MGFDPSQWYYSCAADPGNVVSAARGQVVAATDAAHQAWLAADNRTTPVASYAELYEYLGARVPAAARLLAPGWIAAGALAAADAAAYLLSVGCQIVSTADPALNGIYAIDDISVGKITAVAAGVSAGKGLPGGGATFNLLDMSGAPHAIGASDFLNLAAALENYVYALVATEMSLLGGHGGTWPAQPVTIA